MAVGDVYCVVPTSVATTAYLDVRPSAGYEATVHNIYHENNIELYISDGTNNIKIDTDTGNGAFYSLAIHVTNTHYLRIKNTYASGQYISFSGRYTKWVG